MIDTRAVTAASVKDKDAGNTSYARFLKKYPPMTERSTVNAVDSGIFANVSTYELSSRSNLKQSTSSAVSSRYWLYPAADVSGDVYPLCDLNAVFGMSLSLAS